MARVLESKEFDSEVLKSDLPVLVDFYAEWCGPCKMIGPSIDALSTEMAAKAKIVKIDIDKSPDIASQYAVRSVPTLMMIKNGEVVDSVMGAMPKDALEQFITKSL